jgi:uncharacterized protein (AIM24 family)
MASIISAGTTSATALNLSGDTTGNLAFTTQAGANTITVPNVTGTVILANASNNLQMNSGYGSDATSYGCRAWVNFNGSGTVAIRASGNVSSITDNGTGNYTVNFTSALVDANYSVTGMASDTGGIGNRGLVALYRGITAPTTSAFTVFTFTDTTQSDNTYVYLSVFR